MKNVLLAATLLLTAGGNLAHAITEASVPDAGTTLGLMTGALLGIGVLRSKFRR